MRRHIGPVGDEPSIIGVFALWINGGHASFYATPMIVARLFQNIASGITRRPSLPDSAAGASARSSAGVLAASETRRKPIREAAITALGISETEIALVGSAKTVTLWAPGNACLSNCNRLSLRPVSICVPVTLPARPREALRQPKRNGITARCPHHDRDSARGGKCGQRAARRIRYDHIDGDAHQLRGECR